MQPGYRMLFFLLIYWPALALSQTGYYFIDSGCTGCKLTGNTGIGHYWLISDDVHPFTMDGNERELELIKADFKAELASHYSNYATLSGQLAVHSYENRLAAEQAQRQKVLEKKQKGYQVVERPFWFLSHRGIPMVDDYLIYSESLGFDGVVLIAENDWVVHRRGYGQAQEQGSLPHTPQTVFPVGGVTQTFTAQAIFLLREARRLDLSDNLGKIFRNAPVDKKSITIKQLLMHTSGLARGILPENYESSAEILDAILDSQLLALPGEKYHYSNAGYQLLALIIQKITRQTYDQFLQEQILEPFQLKNTVFYHQASRLNVIAASPLGNAVRSFSPLPTESYVYLGSSGLLTTVEDLFRWFRTLSRMPFFAEMARYQNGQDMAFGFLVNAEGQVITKGDDLHCYARLTYDRTRNRLIMVLSNSDLSLAEAQTAVLSRRIGEIMDGKRIQMLEYHDRYPSPVTGTYAAGSDTIEIQEKNGRLKFLVSGASLLKEFTVGNRFSETPREDEEPVVFRGYVLSTGEKELTHIDPIMERKQKLLFSADYQSVKIGVRILKRIAIP